jgi:hypothetical protein
MYIPIECSPNDQIPPIFFVSINSTYIYISSNKFVDKIFYAYFLLVKNTRLKKMKIFRLSQDSEDKDKISRGLTTMRLEPQPVS